MAKEINLLDLDRKMKAAQPLAFGKGIALAAGFDLGAGLPLDSRIVVDTIEERDAHVTGNRAYEGMLVFVKADKKTYQLLDGAWEEFGFNDEKFQAGIAPLVAKDTEQDSRLATLESLVVGGEGEGLESVIADVAQNKTDIANLQTGLANEISNREDEITRVEGLVAAEQARAEGVEAGLQAAVDTKAAQADFLAEQTRVNAALDAKANEATVSAAFDAIDADILAMDAAYKAADVVVLDAAKAHADQAVADLVNGAPEALDTLKELADALQAHESEYDALLAVVGNKAEKVYVDEQLGLKANVADVYTKSEVDGQVSGLQTEISGVASDLTSAEASLNGKIDAVDSAYKSADSVINDRLTILEGLVVGGEGQGLDAIIADVAANTAGVSSNADAIAQEIADRQAADVAINEKIANNLAVVDAVQPTNTLVGHVWLDLN